MIVEDDFRPTVTIVASDADAAEAGANTGTFTVTRAGAGGSIGASLTVYYTIGGTASNGSDYTYVNTYVNIPAGQASTTITVTPTNDTAVEGDETVVLTLSTNNAAYTIGTPSAATVTITSDE